MQGVISDAHPAHCFAICNIVPRNKQNFNAALWQSLYARVLLELNIQWHMQMIYVISWYRTIILVTIEGITTES